TGCDIIDFHERYAGGVVFAREHGGIIPRLQDLQDGGFEIIRRCKPCCLNLSLLCVFPIIVKPKWASISIEELQGWICQCCSDVKLCEGWPERTQQYLLGTGPAYDKASDDNMIARTNLHPCGNVRRAGRHG